MLLAMPGTRLKAHSFGKQKQMSRNTDTPAMHACQVSFKQQQQQQQQQQLMCNVQQLEFAGA